MRAKRMSLLLALAMVLTLIPALSPPASALKPHPGYWTDPGNYVDIFIDIDNDAKVINITSEAEFALFAKNLSDNSKFYKDWTINLTKDLDLSAYYWKPVNAERIYLEGNWHTIKGLKVDSVVTIEDEEDIDRLISSVWGYYSRFDCTGLFGTLVLSRVFNLILDSPVISYNETFIYSDYLDYMDSNPDEDYLSFGCRLMMGTIAGLGFGEHIRDVVIKNPILDFTVKNEPGESEYMEAGNAFLFIGGVVGYSSEADEAHQLFDGKDYYMGIVYCADVLGGAITVNSDAGLSHIYAGGAVGANYKSLVGCTVVKLDEISVTTTNSTQHFWVLGHIGGITGYTSSTMGPNVMYTCLLNNLSMPGAINVVIDKNTMGDQYEDVNKRNVGGIAGVVLDDAVVNNLYIGETYASDSDYWGTEDTVDHNGMFGVVRINDSEQFPVAFNRSYATIEDAWNDTSFGGAPGGLYGKTDGALNDPNEGGGLRASADVITAHTEYGPEFALDEHRLWYTYTGSRLHEPYLGWVEAKPDVPYNPAAFTVKFDLQDGSALTSTTVAPGGKVTAPTAPKRAGYAFTGWYTDAACTKSFDFNSAIWSSLTLYAGWKLLPDLFDDDNGNWAEGFINSLGAQGYVKGVGNRIFRPNAPLTRAQLVQTFFNAFGDDEKRPAVPFKDCHPNEWYAQALSWAYAKDLIQGYSNEAFGPLDSITREQMAVLAERVASEFGFKLPALHERTPFADDALISAYARDAVYAMQAAGILEGKGGNLFDPQGTLTRAEMAKIMYYVLDFAGKIV